MSAGVLLLLGGSGAAPAPARLGALTTDRQIFRCDGQPWRWKGVSAFQLLDRFARGEPIQPFLDAYQGYTVLRVWPYVEWGTQGWEPPPLEAIRDFLATVRAQGWYTEVTLLTSDEPDRLAWAARLIPELAGTPGLLLEAGNEPQTRKAIQTLQLEPALVASEVPWTTGNYEDAALMRGRYGVTHTARDAEWPRRAHDLVEYYQGGGPNTPSDPPHRFPIVADEPAKLQDVGGNHAQDWRAYFATCAILGAGATFHSETGKYARLPTPAEAQLAAIALEALDAFPADVPLGSYRRIDEQGATLRTYVVGERAMVRIRPMTPTAPEPGWTALDADGITWERTSR